ncbi:MAG: MoxR family ATPase [Candidatus Firestonebacteria bacterium]
MSQELEMKDKKAVEAFAARFDKVCAETEKLMVGLRVVIEDVFVAILAEGNVLLEGFPGLGKTYLIKTLGEVLDLKFRRVQFTADLMPSDILGANILVQDEHGKSLKFQNGPVFTNLLLADEINRATPKTQAALLEAMEEHSVTIGGVTNKLEEPFFVLATQNPIEQDGTFPLPQAQLDKFLLKLFVGYPSEKELSLIAMRTTYEKYPAVNRVLSKEELLAMRRLVREVPVASHVEDFVMKLVRAAQPDSPKAAKAAVEYIERGPGPRGFLGILYAAKARALSKGRTFVSREDVNSIALQVLRHRVYRNLNAEANEISTDEIINKIILEIA